MGCTTVDWQERYWYEVKNERGYPVWRSWTGRKMHNIEQWARAFPKEADNIEGWTMCRVEPTAADVRREVIALPEVR